MSLPVHGADSGGAALNYTAIGLPAGLGIDAATGVISGMPTTPQTTTVTVAAGDQFANRGSTAFTWTIVKPVAKPIDQPKVRSVKLSGLGNGKPKLSLTLTAGTDASALKAVAITLPRGLSFAGKVTTLGKGITLTSGKNKLKFTPKVKRGVLSLTFRTATRGASLTVAKPAMSISTSEAAKVRNHKVKKLVVKLKTTSASRKTVTVSVALTKLS